MKELKKNKMVDRYKEIIKIKRQEKNDQDIHDSKISELKESETESSLSLTSDEDFTSDEIFSSDDIFQSNGKIIYSVYKLFKIKIKYVLNLNH